MRYPAEETAEKHARILEQASILFRERGFSGVSVSEIMKATGLTHGAFYNHFESKDDLISKCIDDASAKALDLLQASSSSSERVGQYIHDYLTEDHRDDRGNGCVMAALASEVAREPVAQPAFTRHLKGVLKSFIEPFAKSKKKAARADAIHKVSSIVGAIILSRAVDDPELSAEILQEVRKALS
jgi:TetR/AcrR family transcriptional repressor of nem operon